MADEINYSIQGIKAEHFTGPISSSKNQWRTVPDLLRAVASWMDETDLQDPECEGLVLQCTFDDNGDDFYKTVTVYHLENERKLDPTEKGVRMVNKIIKPIKTNTCCFIPDDQQDGANVIGCLKEAEWRIIYGNGSDPDGYTESCTSHVGEMLTDAGSGLIWVCLLICFVSVFAVRKFIPLASNVNQSKPRMVAYAKNILVANDAPNVESDDFHACNLFRR